VKRKREVKMKGRIKFVCATDGQNGGALTHSQSFATRTGSDIQVDMSATLPLTSARNLSDVKRELCTGPRGILHCEFEGGRAKEKKVRREGEGEGEEGTSIRPGAIQVFKRKGTMLLQIAKTMAIKDLLRCYESCSSSSGFSDTATE
jgi:hypothetical protein